MMKLTTLLSIAALCAIFFSACSKNEEGLPAAQAGSTGAINPAYSNAQELNTLIQKYVRKGLPGISIAVYSPEGWWEATAGYAKVEDKTSMQPAHLHYLQSIAKMYMAVGILHLKETGKIDLDAPIAAYLPAEYKGYIIGDDKITVRHLLNHTSGIAEYADNINYTAYLLRNPGKRLETKFLLSYIKGKKLLFTPGSKYDYCNTNYELLALIADKICGNHAKLLEDVAFSPLALSNTFYRNDASYLNYPNLVNSYMDRFSDGSIENVSKMQNANAASMIGDDGIVATPRDAVRFLRGVFSGQLISSASLHEMLAWVKDKDGEDIYGMGMYHVKFNGVAAYGHGGSGIGAGCGLYYIPSKNVFVFLGTNIGTVVDGPIVDEADKLKDEIMGVLVR